MHYSIVEDALTWQVLDYCVFGGMLLLGIAAACIGARRKRCYWQLWLLFGLFFSYGGVLCLYGMLSGEVVDFSDMHISGDTVVLSSPLGPTVEVLLTDIKSCEIAESYFRGMARSRIEAHTLVIALENGRDVSSDMATHRESKKRLKAAHKALQTAIAKAGSPGS